MRFMGMVDIGDCADSVMDGDISYPAEAALVLLAQGFGSEIVAPLESEGGDAGQVLLNDPVRREAFVRSYESRRRGYFQRISRFLPDPCDALLDVGCGIALVPLFVHRLFRGATALWLLDRSVDLRSGIRAPGGFHADGYVFTVSLDLTRRFLEDNGVPPGGIHALEAGRDALPSEPVFDLVMSRRSWGMHYPVETYLDDVRAALRPGGRVILDVRQGTNGESAIRKAFDHVETIEDAATLKTLVASSIPIHATPNPDGNSSP